MPRILLTLEYLGTRYSGWQRQANAISVQEVVENALSEIFKQPIRVEGAGRTDAGVHALAQRAHADVPFVIPERGLVLGLNTHLPHDIRLHAAIQISDEFHCRFRAKRKTYLYQIWSHRVASVFFEPTHAHVPRELDTSLMREAASALVGHHDFRSFTVADPAVDSTWRTIESIEVCDRTPRVQIRVTADGFLRYQVRRIAGLLIEIGHAQIPVSRAIEALEPTFSKSRWTAEAKGLVLERVEYGDEFGMAGKELSGRDALA